jgi:thiamine transport system permease protein
LSTILSVALGLPGAWLLSRFDFPLKGLVRALTTVPFVLPSIIVVLGFVRFFGNNGVLNAGLMRLLGLQEPPLRVLYSFQAILLARLLQLPDRRPHRGRAVEPPPGFHGGGARSLGAHGPGFFRVILPQLSPALLAAGALIFIFCFLSFAVVLVLGGARASPPWKWRCTAWPGSA